MAVTPPPYPAPGGVIPRGDPAPIRWCPPIRNFARQLRMVSPDPGMVSPDPGMVSPDPGPWMSFHPRLAPAAAPSSTGKDETRPKPEWCRRRWTTRASGILY